MLAALAATGFAVDLALSYRIRPRPHAGVWAVAMGMYALATWSLAVGLGWGWSEATFKSFFYFGAIANIPLLAAGSVHLNASPRAARWFTIGVSASLALADRHGLKSIALPAISTGVFGFPLDRCARILLTEVYRYLQGADKAGLQQT